MKVIALLCVVALCYASTVYGHAIPGTNSCKIEMRSIGEEDSDYDVSQLSYISVNGLKVFSDTVKYRGINLVLLDPIKCIGYFHAQYDTYGDSLAAAALATFLDGLDDGTWVLGVSEDSANAMLDPAGPMLKSLGVDVDSLGYRQKVIFVIKIGDLSQTYVQIEQADTSHIEYEFSIHT